MVDTGTSDLANLQLYREQEYEELRSQVHRLYHSLDDLLLRVSDTDGLLSEDLVLYARLWARVFDSGAAKLSYELAPVDGQPTLWLNHTLFQSLSVQVMVILQTLESLVDISGANYHVGQLGEQLKAAIRRYRLNDLDYLPPEARAELAVVLENAAHQLEAHRSRSLDRMAERAEKAVSRTEAAAEAASAAAGTTGEATLSAHYESLANDERGAADLFRGLTTFLALVAGGAALGFVLGSGSGIPWLDITAGDYVHLLQRGLLVGGVLGLAGYFARQAHQHRAMANWAGSLAVQLKTFESYLSPIEDGEVKNDLRKAFAARVFGDHPAMKGEPTVSASSALGEKAMDLAIRTVGK